MPYDIKKRNNKWVVVNKNNGKVKGTHDSELKAIKQMRLLYAVESGGFKSKKKRW